MVLLGPGSLYTSIVPNLLVDGVCDAIRSAHGDIVYISNIMTQPGETEGFTLQEHVDVIEQYIGKNVIDKIVANDGWPESKVIEHYGEDGAQLVLPLLDDPRIVSVPMVLLNEETGYVRHNADVLAKTIMTKL